MTTSPTVSLRVVAHRGDSQSARENTVAAVRAGVEAGADLIEIDVRTSKDGRSVVIHDDSTLRLWGRAALVADQTVAELAELGLPGARIPTLDEVIDAIAAADRQPTLLIDSDNADDARVAYAEASQHAAVVAGSVSLAWCGHFDAMMAVRNLDDAAEIWHNHPGGELDLSRVNSLRASVVNVDWTRITPALVAQVNALGLTTNAWTVDDGEKISWLFEIGVASVTSNRPRTARTMVERNATSALSLAWLPIDDFIALTGIESTLARWIWVARQLGEWAVMYTRTATVGTVLDKAHPADVVTAVDTAVERHFREVLNTEFPDHLIVGEEYGGSAEAGRPTWYIDPVDGTTNLANNIPWTSMSLGLAIDNQAQVGCTIHPWTGEIFLAARGLGAVRNGVPLQVRPVDSLAGKALLVEGSSKGLWPGMVAMVEGLADAHCATRTMGSGTLTMTRVADNCGVGGLVHNYSPIDHLAGSLIAAEAGARLLNEDGGDAVFPSGGGMLVAPPGAAEKLWPIWQQALATRDQS